MAVLLWWLGVGVALALWFIKGDLLHALVWFAFVLVCGQFAIARHVAEIEKHLGINGSAQEQDNVDG